MSKKEEKKIKVSCVGMSGKEVTGSSYLVECPTGEKILLDCGMYQDNNKYESWKINKRKLKYKPSELTAIFVSHINIDHFALAPSIYKQGANCRVYTYYKNVDFFKPMLEDCVKIMERDAIQMRKKHPDITPIYDLDDVGKTLNNIRGVDVHNVINITSNVSAKFIPAGHIYGSCQIILYIKKLSGAISKICFSGDLGNILFEQPFVDDFNAVENIDFFIGESTYSNKLKSATNKTRDNDIEKIKSVITETCIDNHGIVLIPCFALQRVETMLYTLWKIFKDDETFKIPIYVDSPLAIKLLECFNNNLIGDDKETFDTMFEWDNIRLIKTIEESQGCVADDQPKIIVSSSGMLTQGRSILYLKKILPKSNCCIITCGYMAEGTLGWKIKNNSSLKTVTIDKKKYKNRCNIKSLGSFSSHMQFEQLCEYYTNIAKDGCGTIWLVHGDDYKTELKEELEKNISKISKTTKVVATNFDTVGRF